jgi:imidazolonepropionase-like amidohydrolase
MRRPATPLLTAALSSSLAMFGAATRARAQTSDDTTAARVVFEGNVDAIHKHDRERYLSYYLQTDALARNGPGGLERGFKDWSARRDSTWPDTLVARDLRLVLIAPGVVYGTYHYRVTQGGSTSEGISERVFVKTPAGWKIAVSTAFGLSAGAAPPPVALVGATLINPGRTAIEDAVILVRGGRIVCAAARAACAVPPGVETVDVRGAFVGPGLIDAHVHYSQTAWVDGRPDAIDLRARFPYDSVVAYLHESPGRFDRAYLCSGVTSVFDVGGYPWTFAMARAHERALDAPRMAAAGPLLTSYYPPQLNTDVEREFVFMKDDSTVRSTVRALVRDGASAIKVWYLQVPDSLQGAMRDHLMAAGAEAQRLGVPLIVHATQLARAKEALRAGAHVLVHSVAPDDVDDEFLTLARDHHAIVIPTLTVVEGYADVYLGRSPAARYPMECVDRVTRAHLETALPDSLRAARVARLKSGIFDSIVQATERNVRRMRTAGIPIAMGTDAGNPGTAPGPSVFREMEALQAAGMPAADVFASATVVAAQAMGRGADLGALDAGFAADLVVWDADPSADITNARRVKLVMKGGALYGRSELLPK